MLKIGIIGVGKMGALHARKFSQLGCEVNVYDSNPEVVKHAQYWSQTKIGACKTLEHIIKKSDAIVVATPAHSLCVAELALMEGKHVLVEKPMALTSFSAKAMKDTAEVNERILHVGYVERFHPCISVANFLIQDQKLTHMLFIRSSIFTERGTGVSVIQDMMVHDIYRMLMLVDKPITSITADGTYRKSNMLDTAYARVEFETGVNVHFAASRSSNSINRLHTLNTTNGSYQVDLLAGTLKEFSGIAVLGRDLKFQNEDPLLTQAKDFIDAIENKCQKSPKLVERAIKTLEIAEQIEEIAVENSNYVTYFQNKT